MGEEFCHQGLASPCAGKCIMGTADMTVLQYGLKGIKLKPVILQGPLEAQGFPITDLRSVPAEYQDEHVRSFCFQPGATSVVQVGAGWEFETPCVISSKLRLHSVVWLGAQVALPQSSCKML